MTIPGYCPHYNFKKGQFWSEKPCVDCSEYECENCPNMPLVDTDEDDL